MLSGRRDSSAMMPSVYVPDLYAAHPGKAGFPPQADRLPSRREDDERDLIKRRKELSTNL